MKYGLTEKGEILAKKLFDEMNFELRKREVEKMDICSETNSKLIINSDKS